MVDRMGWHSKRRNRPRINNKTCAVIDAVEMKMMVKSYFF